MKIKLLDLYCGAGGAGWGYHLAGFEVVGVDKFKQPEHPAEMKFIQADALDILNDKKFCSQFDIIHASPVCKKYSITKSLNKGKKYPDEIPIVREKLKRIKKPYVIENVPGAPLQNYITLCGTMFGLQVIRHRLFECSFEIKKLPGQCTCDTQNIYTHSHRGFSSFENGANFITVAGNNYKADDGRKAMGIDWMTRTYLSQAIPPAYTEYIAKQFKKSLLR